MAVNNGEQFESAAGLVRQLGISSDCTQVKKFPANDAYDGETIPNGFPIEYHPGISPTTGSAVAGFQPWTPRMSIWTATLANATGGTFTIELYDPGDLDPNYSLAGVPYNVTGAALQALFDAEAPGKVYVERTGNVITVTALDLFTMELGVDGTNLTGSTPTITAEEVQGYSGALVPCGFLFDGRVLTLDGADDALATVVLSGRIDWNTIYAAMESYLSASELVWKTTLIKQLLQPKKSLGFVIENLTPPTY